MTSADNPFLALFDNGPVAPNATPATGPAAGQLKQRVHRLLGFTWDPEARGLVRLEDSTPPSTALDVSVGDVERALFERVLMPDPHAAISGPADRAYYGEAQCILYLGQCLRCLLQLPAGERHPEIDPRLQDLVVRNMVTAMAEPDIFQGQDPMAQFGQLMLEGQYAAENATLLNSVLSGLVGESRDQAVALTRILLNAWQERLQAATFMSVSEAEWQFLDYFLQSPVAAELFIRHNCVAVPSGGSAVAGTLLGRLLSLSCLPQSELAAYEFFENPSSQPVSVHNATEARIWTGLQGHTERLGRIFKRLLRITPEVKALTLDWIGQCLMANVGRGKLWTSEAGAILGTSYVSDGFALNLGTVLLELCQPFVTGVRNPKILKVRPMYTSPAMQSKENNTLGVYLKGLDEATTLVPRAEGENDQNLVDEPINFISNIFFMTHKCLDLGFRVVQEKFVKLNQELNRHQQLYREAQGSNPEAIAPIKTRMDMAMTRYLSIKAVLLEPNSLKHLMNLTSATSSYVVQVALTPQETNAEASPDNDTFIPLTFPLSNESHIPPVLAYMPEFLVENICEHMLLARRFYPYHFEESGHESLYPILEMILTFMGSPRWMKNPHLRARLAECLDCLLPHHAQQQFGNSFGSGSFHRERVFVEHPLRLQIVPTLLHVFVSIETTGQSVEFEQKFSYRRPMYDVIKYLWEMEDYRHKFVKLAHHSEEHIEDEDAPLFLRFINLLINDGIFLLDEVLDLMKQIQEKQSQRPDWLPGDIVTTICKIYINLKDCGVFMLAVSADGRSFSPDLFKQAEGVLLKIGKMDMIADLQVIDASVQDLAASLKADDELFADAPDHFLDPIMSILMTDPVRLPSSGQVVDRQTIARHLLSDQSDPFNRMALSLDKVIPQVELKQEIQDWISEKRKMDTA
eukprot:maker-scaffold186_size273091-snap-gene-0.14 protein:Tk00903 transcript:maker-scaffold186_size273091-snap-gene-0.14-mRNA-1 annotation:"ubiquitin conjugation factor e4 a-like"